MEGKFGIGMVENPRPIDFMMESKLEGIIGNSSNSRNFDFFGNSGEMGMGGSGSVGLGDHHHMNGLPQNFHGLCSPAFSGMSIDHGNNVNTSSNGVTNNYLMDSCQRLMLPYDHANHHEDHNASIDVKPNPKQLLSLEWQDQGCSDGGKDSFGYLNGPGLWTGMINCYGSSTTNPLV